MHKGLGKILFHKALNYCKDNEINELRIVSDPNAIEFYVKMGAQKIGYINSLPEPRQLPLLSIEIKT